MINSIAVVKKVINTTREELFEAFSDPEIMSKWFYPYDDMWVEVSNTFQVGGEYVLKIHNKDDAIFIHEGEYKEIVPPEKLVFTWNSALVQNTVVTIEFDEVDSGTEITLTHELLPTEEEVERHKAGWQSVLNRLEGNMFS